MTKKDDRAILDNRGVIYKNYDYAIPDPDGPGVGLYANLKKYKSVKEFLEATRKRMTDRKNRLKLTMASIGPGAGFALPNFEEIGFDDGGSTTDMSLRFNPGVEERTQPHHLFNFVGDDVINSLEDEDEELTNRVANYRNQMLKFVKKSQ